MGLLRNSKFFFQMVESWNVFELAENLNLKN